MGKAKKRSLHLGINNQFSSLTRESAVEAVVRFLKTGNNMNDVMALVTLFGLTAEELLEAGATYESVLGIGGGFLR